MNEPYNDFLPPEGGQGSCCPPFDETQLLRSESAVRRLFSRLPEDGFDPRTFFEITGIRFLGQNFFAAEFSDNPNHPTCPPENVGETTPYQRYLALRNQVLDVLGRDNPVALCNESGQLICVVNWQGDKLNWQGKFSALVTELNQALWNRFHFCLQCTVSQMYPSISSLPKAKEELAQAQNYRRLMGGLPGETLFYDGILRTTGLENREPPTGQKTWSGALFRALLQGDSGKAKEILHGIMQESFVFSRPAVQFVQLRMFEIIDGLLKSLDRAAAEMGLRTELMQLGAAPRLLASQSVWDMEQTACLLLDRFSELLGKNGLRSRLPYRIRAYIRVRFGDVDLNVNKVADVFHVTPTHATRAFKQEFHCGILSYIQQVRVEEAKRLLDSTRSIKEVAQAVGFATPTALLRSFKKLEGTTPARFSCYKPAGKTNEREV